MKQIVFYLLITLLLSACKADIKAGKADVFTSSSDSIVQNSEEEQIHLSEITAEQFAAIYKGKHKMHFKGPNDVETTVQEFRAGKDSAEYVPVHFEDAHDLYISKFTKAGFIFSLNTYTTPSPCLIEGEARFGTYNLATYQDTLGCSLEFTFYKDTLELFDQGCHVHYCGANADLGKIYVLQK